MAKTRKQSKSETENKGRIADERAPEPILLENDGCAGMDLFDISRSIPPEDDLALDLIVDAMPVQPRAEIIA